jgi:hypothetical protein
LVPSCLCGHIIPENDIDFIGKVLSEIRKTSFPYHPFGIVLSQNKESFIGKNGKNKTGHPAADV